MMHTVIYKKSVIIYHEHLEYWVYDIRLATANESAETSDSLFSSPTTYKVAWVV